MIQVPFTQAWAEQPGFETRPCECVIVSRGRPWHDCTMCRGSGFVGSVPSTVWGNGVCKLGLPRLQRDPRFDVEAARHNRTASDPRFHPEERRFGEPEPFPIIDSLAARAKLAAALVALMFIWLWLIFNTYPKAGPVKPPGYGNAAAEEKP